MGYFGSRLCLPNFCVLLHTPCGTEALGWLVTDQEEMISLSTTEGPASDVTLTLAWVGRV